MIVLTLKPSLILIYSIKKIEKKQQVYSLPDDNICKQFGPRSGPTKHWAWSRSKLFDTDGIPEGIFWKSLLWKKSAKIMKNYLAGKELTWYSGTKLAQNLREKWLLPAGQLGRSDSQIERSYSAKLRHFLSFSVNLEANQPLHILFPFNGRRNTRQW